MTLPGEQKRVHDFGVERRWTILRIYRDRARLFLRLSLAAGVLAAVTWLLIVETSGPGRADLARYFWASWLAWQHVESPMEMTLDGQKYRGRPEAFRAAMQTSEYGGRTAEELVTRSLVAGGLAGLGAFAALSAGAWRRRNVERDEEIVKGTGLHDAATFQKVARGAEAARRRRFKGPAMTRRRAGPDDPIRTDRVRDWFDLGGIEIPTREEQKHILVLGDTGAGKSSLLRWYLYQIRLRGEPAIVVDLEREFLQTFYDARTDYVLNPTDRRMPAWAPGLEVETLGEAESLAESFIAGEPGGLNSFFTSTARGALVDVLALFDPYDPGAVARACAMPLGDLHRVLEGRPSASALNPVAAATAENVRATLQTATRGLGLLPRIDPRARPFTLKGWAKNPRGWIFLTTLQSEWVATKPLITAWLDILVRNLLDRDEGAEPVVHVVVDELAALGRSSQIVDVNTRGRKRGVAAKIAAQAVSQVEKNYGKDAKTLLSQPKTKVIYRCSEPDLAEWGSKLIGSVERRVERVNLRADVATRGQDAVTLSEDTRIAPLVLPIQLAQLPDFEAYLTYGGKTTYIRPRFTRQLKLAPGYLPRATAGSARGRAPRPPAAQPPGAPPRAADSRRGSADGTSRVNLDIRPSRESDNQ
jgi:hypothetical protein